MLSIGLVLASFASHLPQGWHYSQGVRSLFPPGYRGSISPLKHYVFYTYAQLKSDRFGDEDAPFAVGNFWLTADGGGRWFFGWVSGNSNLNSGFARQAGVVFKFGVDGRCIGFIDDSNPSVLVRSCAGGTDEVIAKNWPQLFGAGVEILWQIGSDPDPSLVVTGAGFAKGSFTPLLGSNVVGEGSGSGSALFPFPTAPTDTQVASIIASAVARALRDNQPMVADAALVKAIVSSSALALPATASILDFLGAPICGRVISDAQVIASQVFDLHTGSAVKGKSSKTLSLQVAPAHIVAAGTAAYRTLTGKSPPTSLWTQLRGLNV
jgi:hypothetical protein